MMQTTQASDSITEQLIAKTKMMSLEQQQYLLEVLNGKALDPIPLLSGFTQKGNQRRYSRKSCFMPVDYAIKDRFYRDFTRDISAGGLFVEAYKSFSIGERISLSFMLRNYAHPIKVKGRIVRVAPEGIGIKFLQEDARQIDELDEALKEF